MGLKQADQSDAHHWIDFDHVVAQPVTNIGSGAVRAATGLISRDYRFSEAEDNSTACEFVSAATAELPRLQSENVLRARRIDVRKSGISCGRCIIAEPQV